MKEVWSKCNQVYMEIWNSKSSHNMYYDLKVKFRALPNVIFGYSIYHFKAWEVKSPNFK